MTSARSPRSPVSWVVVTFVFWLIASGVPPALAQAPRTGTLQVTVVDPSGAVIPGASVALTGTDDRTKAALVMPVKTSGQGVATFPSLTPGQYAIEAEFEGFEPRTLKDVRIRTGDNKQVVALALAGLQDTVTVGQNRQEAAADPRGPSFGTTLTREQLEALSDDPDVLRRQLQDMAGPGAVITVDSFEGAPLPPKAQIRSIRISRDQFAAENHSGGGISVEIITQPGLGPIRYQTGTRFRGGALSGRNPFAGATPPEQLTNYQLGMSGTLVREKSSFSLYVNGLSSYDTPILNVALANGTRSALLPVKTPRDNMNVYGNLDYALTLDQTLRIGYSMNRNTASNLGIGAYDLPERAYATDNDSFNIRAQHLGPLGRRMFLRDRLQFSSSDSASHSSVEQPTIVVNDAFTRGGAQVAGGQHSRVLEFATDLDYVRSIHTVRTGLLFNASWVHANDTTNYLGTYTFESLDAFNQNRPSSYTRRIGDPNIQYANLQAGWYMQDDVRVRRNLTLSAGLRYEAQTHVADYNNLGPRFGITWAPFASGRTTLRASWGEFYDWLPGSTYEQTLRVDGLRQQEVNILDPTYPAVPDAGAAPPVARYLLGGGLDLSRSSRVSLGIDQRLASKLQANIVYTDTRGSLLLRGENLNAPIDGVRPDSMFGNIIEVVSDAASRQRQAQFNVTVNPGALLPAFNAARVDWHRVTMFVNYTLTSLENNTDGAFSPPPSGVLSTEWAPALYDVPHRFNVTLNNQIVRNWLMQVNVNASSGTPYSIRTGRDDNGDLIFNDRPDGVGRNSLRGPAQWTLNPAMAYTFVFGRRVTGLPPGIAVINGGVQTVDQSGGRYRLQLVVQVQNVTNRANYTGYSGTLTSPFFGRPTAVTGTRKVDAGINFSF